MSNKLEVKGNHSTDIPLSAGPEAETRDLLECGIITNNYFINGDKMGLLSTRSKA